MCRQSRLTALPFSPGEMFVNSELAPTDPLALESGHGIVNAARGIGVPGPLDAPQPGGAFVESSLPEMIELQLGFDDWIVELSVFLRQALLHAPVKFIVAHCVGLR